MLRLLRYLLMTCCFVAVAAQAAEITIPMYLVSEDSKGKFIGNVIAQDTRFGLLLTPHLSDLTPGAHGFHIHENPSCNNLGMAAGGHLDIDNTNKHLGPYNTKGHIGDLPVLYVDKDGHATLPVLIPRLNNATIKNHALIIHEGSDTYSDKPTMGGGARFACGVIPK